MDLYYGVRWGGGGGGGGGGGLIYGTGSYIWGKKHFNMQSVTLITFLSFFSVKLVFWHTSRRVICEICSKSIIKAPGYVELTIKLTIKTPLTSFWSLYF